MDLTKIVVDAAPFSVGDEYNWLAQSDADAARARVIADSATLGARVRVHLPGGELVEGLARSLAADGSLVVEREGREPLTVSAGDVEHLR